MANRELVISSVLHGTEEKPTADRPRAMSDGRVPTFKDLMAPQTVDLFTINYNILTMPRRPMSR
jgi:hypothetical protein